MRETTISGGCLVLSAVAHGFAMFGSAHAARPSPRPLLTELELTAQPVPPPPPPPEPVRPRPTPVAKLPTKTPATQSPSPPSPPSPAEPEPEPEPELTGRTLTATGDSSWSAPAGNGTERGPTLGLGAAAARLIPPLAPTGASPRVLVTQPLGELSRKPAPPSLAAALERNYPAVARRQGQSGEAKVRALIDARGRATSVTVTSESRPGFGAACQKTLQQSQWTPPLGPRGEPTGTFVTYRCRFQVHD